MLAKDRLADPWELYLRVISSSPLHSSGSGYGLHCGEPDLGQVALCSCSDPEGKGLSAVGCGPPAAGTIGWATLKGDVGSTSQCLPQALHQGLKSPG